MRDHQGVIHGRMTLIFSCFSALGTLKAYGQTQLASEMRIRPQIIRRRAASSRHGRQGRGMPVDQLKQLAHIAVRELPPIKLSGHSSESLVAWLIGLDTLTTFDADVHKRLRKWWRETDPRAEPKAKRVKKKAETTQLRELL